MLSYRDTATHGALIAAATAARIMPPWRAEPASYAYRDERRLSDSDIAMLRDWVAHGMPEGGGKPPDPPRFPSGWRLGEPDLVVEMPAGATVTPEVVMIRPDRSIAYCGRIDNYYIDLTKPRNQVTEHDWRDALDSTICG